MQKKAILVLTSSFPKTPGDPNGHFVFELCLRLKKEFSVFVICPKFKAAEKEVVMNGIQVRRHKQFFSDNIELAYGTAIMSKIKKNPLYLFVLPVFFVYQFMLIYKTCRRENIQVIHVHWLIPSAIWPLLYKMLFNPQIKVICTAHGTDVNSFNGRLGTALKKWILKNADAVTAVSRALGEKLNEINPAKKISILPMGIDTSLFTPTAKSNTIKKILNIEGRYILYVGEMIKTKGVDLLIDSMPWVLKHFPNYYLVMVGHGSLTNELKLTCQKSGISEKVIFTGAIPNRELPPYFASADLFVLPSLSEGWPVSVMEALSSGTIPVVTDLPVFTEHADKEKLFKIVKKGSSESISKILIEILSEEEKLKISTGELRNYALNNLDWKIVGSNYTSLIHQLSLN